MSVHVLNVSFPAPACRYGIAFGGYTPGAPTVTYPGPANGFIGTAMFALSGISTKNPNNFVDPASGQPISTHWQDWVYQWAFSATATTIPAGCVAERFNFNAYLGECILLCCS